MNGMFEVKVGFTVFCLIAEAWHLLCLRMSKVIKVFQTLVRLCCDLMLASEIIVA